MIKSDVRLKFAHHMYLGRSGRTVGRVPIGDHCPRIIFLDIKFCDEVVEVFFAGGNFTGGKGFLVTIGITAVAPTVATMMKVVAANAAIFMSDGRHQAANVRVEQLLVSDTGRWREFWKRVWIGYLISLIFLAAVAFGGGLGGGGC